MGNLGISILNDESDYVQSSYVESSPTIIKVVGCGGGGSNAVNRMISRELSNVDFIVINTDLQALGRSNAHTKLAIGQKVTKGLGAGGRPEVGEQAAEEDKEQITNELRGADMVFITAGMGGGTGTGSAPIVARIAKELGCLTVAVVTTPFEFEGSVRMRRAKEGLLKLREQVDSLIVIPNEQLFKNIDKNLTVRESFKRADEVLCQGVEGISNIITNPGDVNTDFADVKNAMEGQGNAIFGIGVGEGENRAQDAAYNAIHNPMLENSQIDGAKNLLVNICASEEITLSEVGEICKIVAASADKDYVMYWGQVTQPELEGKISVTVIATGFENKGKSYVQPAASAEVVEPLPQKVRDDVVSQDELKSLFGENSDELPASSFVSKKEIDAEKENSEKKRGNLMNGLFDDNEEEKNRQSANLNRRQFNPPAGWNPDANDLSQPAIWTSEFGRGIRLSDD